MGLGLSSLDLDGVQDVATLFKDGGQLESKPIQKLARGCLALVKWYRQGGNYISKAGFSKLVMEKQGISTENALLKLEKAELEAMIKAALDCLKGSADAPALAARATLTKLENEL